MARGWEDCSDVCRNRSIFVAHLGKVSFLDYKCQNLRDSMGILVRNSFKAQVCNSQLWSSILSGMRKPITTVCQEMSITTHYGWYSSASTPITEKSNYPLKLWTWVSPLRTWHYIIAVWWQTMLPLYADEQREEKLFTGSEIWKSFKRKASYSWPSG